MRWQWPPAMLFGSMAVFTSRPHPGGTIPRYWLSIFGSPVFGNFYSIWDMSMINILNWSYPLSYTFLSYHVFWGHSFQRILFPFLSPSINLSFAFELWRPCLTTSFSSTNAFLALYKNNKFWPKERSQQSYL